MARKYYTGFSEEFAFEALKLIRHIVMSDGCINVDYFKGVLMIKPTKESIQTDMETGWINITDFAVGRTNNGEYYIHTTDPVVLSDNFDIIDRNKKLNDNTWMELYI